MIMHNNDKYCNYTNNGDLFTKVEIMKTLIKTIK